MSRNNENSGFICANCEKRVSALTNGSYRNHCPFCLFSLHVDDKIGDRESSCHGKMEPKGILYNSKKGYQLIHICQKCGARKLNKIAVDTDMPDDFEKILLLITQTQESGDN